MSSVPGDGEGDEKREPQNPSWYKHIGSCSKLWIMIFSSLTKEVIMIEKVIIPDLQGEAWEMFLCLGQAVEVLLGRGELKIITQN